VVLPGPEKLADGISAMYNMTGAERFTRHIPQPSPEFLITIFGMGVRKLIGIACAAVFAGAAFEWGRILVRRAREPKRAEPDVGRPYDRKTGPNAAPHGAVTRSDTLHIHEVESKLSASERQATKATPCTFAQPVKVDASLRQNLRLKYLYDEAKIDQAIASEREGNPDGNLNDLMKSAIERWERDNR
jgi:hypothetical protein